jgi:hypothetical protein
MNIKSTLIAALSIGLLFITQIAHADFRKALDAYIARDGATMLKEVKDAVDKKNDDGLMLFLNTIAIDETTSFRSKLYFNRKDTPIISKMTLEEILDKDQKFELIKLLNNATQNSTPHSQYFLLTQTIFQNEVLLLNSEKYRNSINELNDSFVNNKKSQKEIDDQIWSIKQDLLLKLGQEYASKGVLYAIEDVYRNVSSLSENKARKNIELEQDRERWKLKLAEAGDPFSQFSVGLNYLNNTGDYGCSKELNTPLCKNKDETKAWYWLKKAAKGYYDYPLLLPISGAGYNDECCLSFFANQLGDLIVKQYQNNPKQIQQAYLWYSLALNSPNRNAPIYEDKLFKLQSRVDKNFSSYVVRSGEKAKANNLKLTTKTPDMINNINSKSNKGNTPIFSYTVMDYLNYRLDVYQNGKVYIEFSKFEFSGHRILGSNRDLLIEVSPTQIKQFLKDIKAVGYYDWPVSQPSYGVDYQNYDDLSVANSKDVLAIVYDGKTRRMVYMSEALNYPVKDQLRSKRINQLEVIVEKHFPTIGLRCKLSSSKIYIKECNNNLNLS